MRSTESVCPFCSSALSEAPPERAATGRGITRAAILFAGATAITGCSTQAVPMYGPAPVDGSTDVANDANNMPDVVAMYGPAPVDAGEHDASDAATDATTPLDAGDG